MKAPLGPERRRFKVLGATRYVSSITSSYDGCQGKQDHHSKDRPRFYGELNGNLPDTKSTSLSLSEGFDSAKAISVPFIKAKPGMAMAPPAAVILKNERRLCVDTVLKLFIRLSLCHDLSVFGKDGVLAK